MKSVTVDRIDSAPQSTDVHDGGATLHAMPTRSWAGLSVVNILGRSLHPRLLPVVFVAIAAAITAVIVLIASWQLAFNRAQAIEGATRDVENLARALDEQVTHTFRTADNLAWSIKQQVERYGLPDDLQQFVSERALSGEHVLVAHITDEHGTTLRHSLAKRAINIAQVKHFQINKASDPQRLIIGEPVVGRSTKKWSVHVSRRINRPDGSFAGVVSIAIDQGYFSRVYGQLKLDANGFVALVGLDGVMRAYHGQDSRTTEHAIGASIVERAQAASAATYISTGFEDQSERIVAYRQLRQYPLVVVVGAGLDAVLNEYHAHRKSYVSVVCIGTLLLWLGLALLASIIVRQRRAAVLLAEANRRAESANRVKSEFLANMTHELRTPLNGIIGFADCLQEELADESQRECARIIYSSGCTLLGMVNSVLDIAKIEAGRMALQISAESVRLLVEEVVAVHRTVIEGKGLRLELDLAADLPDAFPCDRAKLMRVLHNLLHNAIKFTDEGHVRVTARMDAGTLVLSVRDTGCGISPAMHQAIFERFTQSEESGIGLRGGTGLGLALARDLVHLMGGRMEVHSQPGHGAEFRLGIPPAAGAAT